jgi:hypothetical protein
MRDKLLAALRFLWKFFVGGIVVLVAFTANFVDFRRSNVSVEITGIERNVGIIDLSAFDSQFKEALSPDNFFETAQSKYTPDELKDRINDMIRITADKKDRAAAELEAAAMRVTKTNKKNGPDISDFLSETPEDLTKDKNRAEAQLQVLKKGLDDLTAYVGKTPDATIIVTAAVINTGDGATSLKPQALLRADLGQGNYLDIGLTIVDYAKGGTSELHARGVSVLQFKSQPIGKMSKDDQMRFEDFFKNTSPTNLFICDVRGSYFKSNTIPFAEGVYEQRIYDSLKSFATLHQK